ncbi:hypothetical protein EV424DRAFT_1331454 [Suillus variegatus]|nr:hypothetical protein EV424DRAFT_1331454 [Suillus variegatus]
MHLVQLLADLFLSLWRGKIDYTAPDHPSTWPWAIFRDVDMWQAHEAAVAAAGQYLPGSFDRKPRDPAQKINTGYKTWEFQIYIFGLGPALLFNVLPQPYWCNYCRIVRAFHLINQHSISVAELQAAHTAFNEWEVEFELLYYERRAERLHFIRPCVHQVSHLITQTIQKGPPICYSQWTMERMVGNLGQEIRQPSNPYSNLSREGVRRCQVNALKAIIPELDVPPRGIPSTAIDLGGGYVLLRKRDYRAVHPSQAETIAIEAYLGLDAHKIHRWARLRLPNGQIVRTAWRETLRPPERPIRVSRNVKLVLDGDVRLAEVQYFTRLAAESGIGEDGPIWSWKDVAIVVMYSQPDADLLDLSFQAVSSCAYLEDDIRVVNIKSIKAVVGMVPHKPTLPSGVVENRFFLVEKPGLDIATFGVPYEGPGAQDDEDDDDEENMDDIE